MSFWILKLLGAYQSSDHFPYSPHFTTVWRQTHTGTYRHQGVMLIVVYKVVMSGLAMAATGPLSSLFMDKY